VENLVNRYQHVVQAYTPDMEAALSGVPFSWLAPMIADDTHRACSTCQASQMGHCQPCWLARVAAAQQQQGPDHHGVLSPFAS